MINIFNLMFEFELLFKIIRQLLVFLSLKAWKLSLIFPISQMKKSLNNSFPSHKLSFRSKISFLETVTL